MCTLGSGCPWLWVTLGPSQQSIFTLEHNPWSQEGFCLPRLAGLHQHPQTHPKNTPQLLAPLVRIQKEICTFLTSPYRQSYLLIPQQVAGCQFNSSPQQVGKATLWQNSPCHHQTCSGDKTNSSSSQPCQLAPCTGCSAGQKA